MAKSRTRSNNSSSKKATAARHARAARQARFVAQHPHYVACAPGEAERELGETRAAELTQTYGAPLQQADVILEKLLRGSTFRIVDGIRHGGRAWTLSEYVDNFNAECAIDDERNGEEPDPVDGEWVIDMLHRSHRGGELLLNADLSLGWH